MTRAEALAIAKTNYEARLARDIATGFANYDAAQDEATFGFRHGWYVVAGFSFNDEEVTGHKYDANQGGWAWV